MNKDIKNPLDSAFFAESRAKSAESSIRFAESSPKFFVRVAESNLNFAESSPKSAESTQIQGLKNDA